MRFAIESVDVAVLAGGMNTIPLFEGWRPGYKALLPLNGKPLLQYTLDAVTAVQQIRGVCIVGSQASLQPAVTRAGGGPSAFAPEGATLLDSIVNGLRHFADSQHVLVVTADLPLLTARAVREFLAACAHIETAYAENVFLALVPERCYTGPFTRVPKRLNRFRDIAVCHGNVALVTPRILRNTKAVARINHIYAARKSPILAALAVGGSVALSYIVGVHILHALTLRHIARVASRRFGVGLIPVILERPEVTIDVDEAADYAFVTEYFKTRGRSEGSA